jgi:hypothetical protein
MPKSKHKSPLGLRVHQSPDGMQDGPWSVRGFAVLILFRLAHHAWRKRHRSP